MKTSCCDTLISLHRPTWLVLLLLALPLIATAQSAPTTSGDMSGMDMDSMPGMTMPAPANSTTKLVKQTSPTRKSTKQHPVAQPAASKNGMDSMKGMDHGAMPKADQGGMSGMDAMPSMTMGPMQGGSAPPDARSPDYSDGVGYGSMKGMDMADNAPIGMLLIDQLEAFHGRNGNGQSWEAEGWYGRDENKLWLRSEGERSADKVQDGNVEALWNHSISTYWSTQLGARHDLGTGPARDWAAFGVQGLAPYWFELEATGYVDPAGRSSARFRANYEVLFTQRLILQPELEANLYGKNDPALGIGSGLSDVQFGLRLRYEIRRQFAPYIGVNWVRRTGTTADYARADGQHALDRQILAGLRIWL